MDFATTQVNATFPFSQHDWLVSFMLKSGLKNKEPFLKCHFAQLSLFFCDVGTLPISFGAE